MAGEDVLLPVSANKKKTGGREENEPENTNQRYSSNSDLCCTLCSFSCCSRTILLWTNSNSNSGLVACGCPTSWFSRGFRPHTWSIRRQHILNSRSNRLTQHYTFVCNVILCLLRLQTQ